MYASALLSVLLPLLGIVNASPAARTTTFKVTYDNTYDNPAGSLNSVACSNGKNGLLTKDIIDFGDLPSFPFIGGGQPVASWNSSNCGTCWGLTFGQNTINSILYLIICFILDFTELIMVIDTAADGFNIAQEAMDALTDGRAVQLGFVEATVVEVDPHKCRR